MAKVWFARRGPEPTRGEAFAELTLPSCMAKLGLQQSNWKSPLEETPKFEPHKKLGLFTNPQFVVIEIDKAEGEKHRWRAGFYLLDISPEEAKQKLSLQERS